MFIGVFIGRTFVTRMGGFEGHVLGLVLTGKQLLALLTAAMMSVSVLCIRHIDRTTKVEE